MYGFTYHRPTTVRQVASLLKRAEEAKLLAGGQTLLPTMKQRLASPQNLIDLARVEGLTGMSLSGRTLSVGAMSRHVEVATSALVREALPVLASLAEGIGDPQVRNRGTMGGSIANNDPTADYPAACLGLGATIVTNKRRIKADDFFVGLFETALEPDEIVTKVLFPLPSKAAYVKFPNPASRYAMVGAFVAKRGREVRVAITGSGANGVFRLPEAEAALSKRFSVKALEGLTVSADGLVADIHGSAEYRAHLVGVNVRRAVAAATAR
jgi:carbon-monoxide dehydrogenase medium subunit